MTELSNITKSGKLVSYSEWEKYITGIKKELEKSKYLSEDKGTELVAKSFEKAVLKRIPKKRFGIFFSGGVDSTLISYLCKKHTDNFICYTVGLENSPDVEMSKKISKELKLNHVHKILNLDDTERLFRRLAKILPVDALNVVNLGVGAVVLAVIDIAKKNNIDIFFGGLGSEEIFAGYHRHGESENINQECWNGLISTYKRDFLRDYSIAKATNCNFLTPYLDEEMIRTAMRIPGKFKIKDGYKKHILRCAAVNLGLKKEFSFRPKKAAQYGSRTDKAISKLSKKKGFRYKGDYINFLSENK